MEEQLLQLFKFLNANRDYNHSLHEKIYCSNLCQHGNPKDKVISLLYHVVNTQRQPKINLLGGFFKALIPEEEAFNSFENFVQHINYVGENGIEPTFKNLFIGLKKRPGWGNKTAALFSKMIFQLHSGQYPAHLRIWDDVPEINANDNLYLPVDAVIEEIFQKLDSSKRWDFNKKNMFNKINKTLEIYYNREAIEIWDDLWFWGYFNQIIGENGREFGWNENKYWANKETDKDQNVINAIKKASGEFLQILQPAQQ